MKLDMNDALLAGFVLILIGIHAPSHAVDKELEPFYSEVQGIILEECQSHKFFYPNQTSVRLGGLELGVVGLCSYNTRTFIITIDRKFFHLYNSREIFSIMAHEMTHCELGMDHSLDKNNYMYESLNPRLTKSQILEQLRYNIKGVCK